jgi:hypothetical protein
MDFDKLFSTPRMASYKKLSSSLEQAEKLYHWNILLSAAMYECLVLVEVALRNSIDRQLRYINQTLKDPDGVKHSSDWLNDPNYVINISMAKDAIALAKERAYRQTKQPTQDDILAQMTFGNWRYILPSQSKRNFAKNRIWEEGVKDAFNFDNYSLQRLAHDLKDLNNVRNRIAHAEPLIVDSYTKNTMRSIYRVAKSIDPELERYIKSTQRVTYINKQRPR